MALKKHHGGTYVVKYLKACQLSIQKAIAGTPLTSLTEVGACESSPRLDSRGLPRVIPYSDRKLIMHRGYSIIRFWLTLFSIYRIIKIPGTLKLETITDPGIANPSRIFWYGNKLSEISACLPSKPKKIRGENYDILLLEKASPTSKVS